MTGGPLRKKALRALLVLALLATLVATPGAGAHAVLQSANPPPNGHADAGLTRVDLVFSEDIEHEYSNAHLEDANGDIVANVTFSFDDAQRNVDHLTFPPLPDGIYSVFWQALSVDSHTTQGAFIFATGNATIRYPAEFATTSAQQNVLPEGVARAVYYSGLFLALGVPVFLLAIARDARLPARPFATTALFAMLGAAAALLGLLELASRAGIAFGTAAATGAGLSFLWRSALLAASAIAAFAAFFDAPRRPLYAWAGIALALGSLLATTLGSHAAADKSYQDISIAVDALHLVMGAIWIGGVIAFLHVVWGRDARGIGTLVERFTPLAIGSVVLLLATGTYASLRHIPTIADLWQTPYGLLVSAKVILLAPLVAIGAYNKEILGPRLRSGAGSARHFRRVLQVEALVMASVLLAAGVLASSAPPDQRAGPAGVVDSPIYEDQKLTKTSHVIIDIRPKPIVVGLQNLTIAVHPLTRVPVGKNTTVYLKIAQPGEPEPDIFYEPAPTRVTNDTWQLAGGLFTTPGTWRLYVAVQRTDVPEYSVVVFDIPVQAPAPKVTA